MTELEEAQQNEINEKKLTEMQLQEHKDLDLIFFIPEGVRIHTIEGAEVSVPSCSSSLQVLHYSEHSKEIPNNPSVLIQIGEWIYPLSKETPVLVSEDRTFLVSHPIPDHPDLSVAIVLGSEVNESVVEDFIQILHDCTDLHEFSNEPEQIVAELPKGRSERLTNYLVSGGESIAGKIQKKAANINKRIIERGERYRATVQPKDTPTHIAPSVKGGVHYVHKGTKVVVKVTDKLFDKIGEIGTAVGKAVASGATKILGENETAEKSIKVVGGGAAAVGSVLFSLAIASKTLCKSWSNQTVQNVRHKYGEEASETTKTALSAAGHGGMAAFNITRITPHALIQRVGFGAGITTVSNLHTNLVGQPIPLRIPGMVPPPPPKSIEENNDKSPEKTEENKEEEVPENEKVETLEQIEEENVPPKSDKIPLLKRDTTFV